MARPKHDRMVDDPDIPLLRLENPPPFEEIHMERENYHMLENTKSNITATSATSSHFSSATLREDVDPPKTCFQDYKDDWWLLEIASMTINILTITTMATLLSVYQNRPLSVWTFWISLNTLISFLGTIAKTSLLYAVSASISQGKWIWFMKRRPLFDFETIESASQGVVGSVICFWRLRPRNFISIGLFITISALFVGPVYQQVISYEGQGVPVHLTSTMASSQRLNMGTEILGTHSSRNTNSYGNVAPSLTSQALDFSMIAAIYNGLLSNGNSSLQQHASFSCSTGNCTFPVYASIAICNQCTDVSKNLNQSLLYNKLPDGWSTLIGSDNYEEDLVQYDLLPNHLVSMNNLKGLFPWNQIGGEVLVARVTALPNETIANTANDLMVMSTTYLRANSSYVQNITVWEETHIEAVECALSLCINVYNSSIIGGELDETIISSSSSKAADSWQLRPSSSQPSSVSVVDTSDPDLGNSSWNPLWHSMWYNRTDVALLPSTEQVEAAHLPPNSTFNITQTSINTLQAFFLAMAPNTITVATSSGEAGSPQQQYVLIEGDNADTVRGQVLASSDFMRALHGSANISATMDFLARSMTNAVRDNGAVNSYFTTGTTWTFETFILVDWWLYVFPVGLSLLGSLLLCVAMWKSRQMGVRPWKLNSLPILFHGLEDRTLKKAEDNAGDGGMLRIRHMEETSMGMYVGLTDGPEEIKLV